MAESAETSISFLLAVGTIGILLPVISIIIFVVVYQKKLVLQQLKLHEKEALHRKELLKTSLNVQEEERSRIARDLHDEVIQSLTAIKHYLNSSFKPREVNSSAEPLLKAMNAINETIVNIRGIINGLLPSSLDRNGLEVAIREMSMKLSEVHKLEFVFTCNAPLPELNNQSELMIYRSIQEILSNIIRHSGATRIEIKAESSGSHLMLEIVDNGRGMEIPGSDTSHGIGLKSIDIRIRALDASIGYYTEELKGTRVKVVVPLNSDDNYDAKN